jgi:pyruvate/2-oxoglutarate dehydrogenase complex dihydrolipoamide dehydrogenase (E3) component
MAKTYDLLVIGAGAAGSAAIHAAPEGARLIQIERDKIGGTCLNYGCDPTKTLLHIARELYHARQSERLGLLLPLASVEWPQVQAYVRSVVDRMRGGKSEEAAEQLRRQGIDFLAGEARFVSPHEVAVNGQIVAAERIVLATGCQAVVPEIEGLQEAGFITNVGAVSLAELPNRLAIVGGGAIGIEFAQMFQRFGVKVTVLEQGSQILEKEDKEFAEKLSQILTREGVNIITGAELQRVRRTPHGKQLIYRSSLQGESELVVDELLLALGRRPAVEKLDLEKIGVKTAKNGIEVDQTLRTTLPHIWAAGDVATRYKFTHVANEQGILAARNAFSDHPTPFDDRVIPWVTFTDPPLAHVGRTEEELRQQNVAYRTARLAFETIERALIMGQTEGFIKLLVDEQEHILGAHILGPRADDLLASLVVAMRTALPVTQLAETLLPYPTLSEGLRWAAGQIR